MTPSARASDFSPMGNAKVIATSLVAMAVAWALPLLVMALGQLITSGRTADVGVMGLWVGLFTLASWGLVVIPLLLLKGKTWRSLYDPRVSWLAWGCLALAVYIVAVVPILGFWSFFIAWYPSVMGVIAGLVFALLNGASWTRWRSLSSARKVPETP